jgi:hypothetical protein
MGMKVLLDLPGHRREKVTVKYAATSMICYIGSVSSESRARTLKRRGSRNI